MNSVDTKARLLRTAWALTGWRWLGRLDERRQTTAQEKEGGSRV